MEENLMEKLLNDFSGTLEEFNQLVANKDIEGVRRVLDEVNRLLQERNGIVLDDREDPQYDHVLHELLDKMTGIVEKETTIEGYRYYTNEEVKRMIEEERANLELIQRNIKACENVGDEQGYAIAIAQRSEAFARISDLEAAIIDGQEFSSLTYIDEHLANLQKERSELLEEKNRLKAEIAELENGSASEEYETDVSEQLKEKIEKYKGTNDSQSERAEIDAWVLEELENVLKSADEDGKITIDTIKNKIENLKAEKETLTSKESNEVKEKINEIIEYLRKKIKLIEEEIEKDPEIVEIPDRSFVVELNGYMTKLKDIQEDISNGDPGANQKFSNLKKDIETSFDEAKSKSELNINNETLPIEEDKYKEEVLSELLEQISNLKIEDKEKNIDPNTSKRIQAIEVAISELNGIKEQRKPKTISEEDKKLIEEKNERIKEIEAKIEEIDKEIERCYS